MKTLLLAAALAVISIPAFAQGADVPPPPPHFGPSHGERHGGMLPPGSENMSLEEMKAKMAEHKAKRTEMEGKMEAGRKAMDAHRDDCYNKMQAAGSKEDMKAIGEKCREEGKKMHEARRAEMKEKHGDMKAKRKNMYEAGKAAR